MIRLDKDASGHSISKVHVIRDNQFEQFSADIVVVPAGALSSALRLLHSANDTHPHVLATGFDQVGRNYMRHDMSVVMAVLKEPDHTVFQKALALSDCCFDASDWEYSLGLIQMCAASWRAAPRRGAAADADAARPAHADRRDSKILDEFWLQGEDLPWPENRIAYDGDRVVLSISEGNEAAARRLRQKLEAMLVPMRAWPKLIDRRLDLGKDIPINGIAHQAGTPLRHRSGKLPARSRLPRARA